MWGGRNHDGAGEYNFFHGVASRVDLAIAHAYWRGVAPSEIKEMDFEEIRYWQRISESIVNAEIEGIEAGKNGR